MGGETERLFGPPDWARGQLQRFAFIDETTDGFTELRVHGVSGPPPEHVLDYPAAAVTLVRGNATSGFWRRWRLGGGLEDVPHQHHIEAFSWGGLTSRAARQALWLPLLPFSLVNLSHWMLPPFTRGGLDKGVSVIAVSLLRVLGLSFTVTLALAGAEVTMDLGAWQCGANAACLATLQRHNLLGRFLNDPGPRVAIGAGLLFLVLLVLLLAGNARFQPLRDSDPMNSPVVLRNPDARPALGDPKFWEVDHSTRWLRCLHTVAWCAATGAVACGALAAVRPKGNHNVVGAALACGNLLVLATVFGLVFWQRFGRGGKAWRQTGGYRWINLAAVGLLVASLTLTAIYMPAHPKGSHPVLPYVQGALGWLTFGQAITLIVLAGCVGWLAWRFATVRRADETGDRTGSRPWGPLLGGMLTLVVAVTGWLLGLALSAGYGLWVADRLRTDPAHGGFRAVLPNYYNWIDANAVVAVIIVLIWAGYLACRVVHRIGDETEAVLTGRPAEPETGGESTPAEERSRAKAAARWEILAQSVETVPVLLFIVAVAGLVLLVPGWFVQFSTPGLIKIVASAGAWFITIGTAALVVVAYIAFRNQSTRRIVGILWDITTFWPRANHPLTPPCSAQRAVPQLADRIAALTEGTTDFLVLSAHSQGSVLAAAAVLRLAQDEDRRSSLGRMSLLTYGSPLRRLYARGFPAYFPVPVLEEVKTNTDGRWLNLWSRTDPIGADIALPSASAGCMDWQMLPDPLTLDVDPRTGEPVKVCDHSGYLSRPEYPLAVELLRRLPSSEEYLLGRRGGGALDGSREYVLHMTARQLPGEGGTWLVTLYEKTDGLFRNSLMRFCLGSDSGQPIAADDGDIDIYVQARTPAKAQQPNWLPAPPGDFIIVLRIYWPPSGKPEGWTPPFLDPRQGASSPAISQGR